MNGAELVVDLKRDRGIEDDRSPSEVLQDRYRQALDADRASPLGGGEFSFTEWRRWTSDGRCPLLGETELWARLADTRGMDPVDLRALTEQVRRLPVRLDVAAGELWVGDRVAVWFGEGQGRSEAAKKMRHSIGAVADLRRLVSLGGWSETVRAGRVANEEVPTARRFLESNDSGAVRYEAVTRSFVSKDGPVLGLAAGHIPERVAVELALGVEAVDLGRMVLPFAEMMVRELPPSPSDERLLRRAVERAGGQAVYAWDHRLEAGSPEAERRSRAKASLRRMYALELFRDDPLAYYRERERAAESAEAALDAQAEAHFALERLKEDLATRGLSPALGTLGPSCDAAWIRAAVVETGLRTAAEAGLSGAAAGASEGERWFTSGPPAGRAERVILVSRAVDGMSYEQIVKPDPSKTAYVFVGGAEALRQPALREALRGYADTGAAVVAAFASSPSGAMLARKVAEVGVSVVREAPRRGATWNEMLMLSRGVSGRERVAAGISR